MERKGIISAGNWLVDNIKIIERYPHAGQPDDHLPHRNRTGRLLAQRAGRSGTPRHGPSALCRRLHRPRRVRRLRPARNRPLRHRPAQHADARRLRHLLHRRHVGDRRRLPHLLPLPRRQRPPRRRRDRAYGIPRPGFSIWATCSCSTSLDRPDPEYGVVAARVLDGLRRRGTKRRWTWSPKRATVSGRSSAPVFRTPTISSSTRSRREPSAVCSSARRKAPCCGNAWKRRPPCSSAAAWEDSARSISPKAAMPSPRSGERCWCDSVPVARHEIVSSVGAGDAFCAGMLYAQHERMPLRDALRTANASARFNLFSATSTGGAPTLHRLNEFIHRNYTEL